MGNDDFKAQITGRCISADCLGLLAGTREAPTAIDFINLDSTGLDVSPVSRGIVCVWTLEVELKHVRSRSKHRMFI